MPKPDSWAAGFLALAGLAGLWEALKLPLGTVAQPGPGFFPVCLAAAFSVVALALVVQALRGGAVASLSVRRRELGHRRKVGAALGSLSLYAFLLEPLGFLLATVLLLIFFFSAIEPQRWPVAVGGSVAASLLTYGFFKLWLGVQLPAGLFGF